VRHPQPEILKHCPYVVSERGMLHRNGIQEILFRYV
jgi:hypothetical protein